MTTLLFSAYQLLVALTFCVGIIAYPLASVGQTHSTLPKPSWVEAGILTHYNIPISYTVGSQTMTQNVSRFDKNYWASIRDSLVQVNADTIWEEEGEFPLSISGQQLSICDRIDTTWLSETWFRLICLQEDTSRVINPGVRNVHIQNSLFDIKSSAISGVGLYCTQNTSFAMGQDIVYVFLSLNNDDTFDKKYIETIYGSFVNHSESPNSELIIADYGIILRAKEEISSGEEITASYKQLIALFPKDRTVEKMVRFW
ncbi:MAG: SET domain-containing protein [Bacteroidetes bacterium]|nr:SET domain-containing protein [Bacteroidota bacterium]